MTDRHAFYPEKLKEGDVVGIVSPSWCGPHLFPHRFERGLKALSAMGFQIRLGEHASTAFSKYLSAPAESRAADLMGMFLDPDVKAIIGSIGGDHSCQMLPFLDFEQIAKHPKILLGFSDITVLQIALWTKSSLVTFYGPTIMTEFAEFPMMPEYTKENLLNLIMGSERRSALSASTEWTDEFLDWGTETYLERRRTHSPNPGWKWLKEGVGNGTLIGGCTSSLEHLRGTDFWPDWKNAVLFLETSEEKPSPSKIDALLSDYFNMGVLSAISGLLIGRPSRYSPTEKVEFFDIVMRRCSQFSFPIVAELDIGHTSPMMTLPIGGKVRIDSVSRSIEICHTAVS